MKNLIFFIVFVLFATAAPILSGQEIKAILDESPETIRSQFVSFDTADISNWSIQTGEQSCLGELHIEKENPERKILSADFVFRGDRPIEYLALHGKKTIEKPGDYFGIRAKIDLKDGAKPSSPYFIRLCDKSGETHQIRLNVHWDNNWFLGEIKESNPHWGGDENGKLDFPCQFSSLIMDKATSKWKAEGTLTVYEIRFFKRRQTEKAIAIDLPDFRTGGNLFEPDDSTRSVQINVRPLEKFRDKKIDLAITRQVNGEMLPVQKVALSEFKKFTLSGQPGFVSIQVAPYIRGTNGDDMYYTPLKYSFAVLPKATRLNLWFGVSTHRNYAALDRVPRAGIGFIRDEFHWGAIEREKGKYVFDKSYDEFYDRVAGYGVEPLIILDYASKFYDGGDFPHSDEAVAAYAKYCAAIAEHLKGRCRFFEIWNEWTGGCGMSHFSANKHNTPENYVKLIKAASEAIRKVAPDAYIIGGGGDHHVGHFGAISKMMELGVMKYCDAFSVHPYVYPRSPEKAECQRDLQKVIDVMKANGCAQPKIWLTEHGWPTYRGLSGDPTIDDWSFTLEDYSASMMARTSLIYKSMPEIEAYCWYDLENDGTDLYYNENNFGILHNRVYGCQPKASYAVMSNMTQLLADAKVIADSKYTTDTRKAYLIEKSNGQRILAIWTVENEEKFDLPGCRAFGIYGNTLSPSERKASVRPIFFELKK